MKPPAGVTFLFLTFSLCTNALADKYGPFEYQFDDEQRSALNARLQGDFPGQRISRINGWRHVMGRERIEAVVLFEPYRRHPDYDRLKRATCQWASATWSCRPTVDVIEVKVNGTTDRVELPDGMDFEETNALLQYLHSEPLLPEGVLTHPYRGEGKPPRERLRVDDVLWIKRARETPPPVPETVTALEPGMPAGSASASVPGSNDRGRRGAAPDASATGGKVSTRDTPIDRNRYYSFETATGLMGEITRACRTAGPCAYVVTELARIFY